MKILHFILGKANKDRANGVNQVVAGLGKYSARLGAAVRMIGIAESVEKEGEIIARDGFYVKAFSRWGTPLRSALAGGIRWANVVHLHGVYSPWNLLVARMCDDIGRPYIVTLHDGLAPVRSKEHGQLKKWAYHTLLQRRHLNHAAGVHVLTEEEATDLLSTAQPKNVFCIPNGIDLEDYPSPEVKDSALMDEINIGYLGRLSREKNLESLCVAFAKVNTEFKFRLKLAGPPSAYGRSLIKRFAHHGVEGMGVKFGEEKYNFLRSMNLFVHPSLCDVFSITAMEVLAIGTPLLITRTSKASYFYDHSAYFMCEPTAFGLERGIRLALDRQSAWAQMSVNGRRLIESRLNWHTAASKMLEAYTRIVAGSL